MSTIQLFPTRDRFRSLAIGVLPLLFAMTAVVSLSHAAPGVPSSDGVWQGIDKLAIPQGMAATLTQLPRSYELFELNQSALEAVLADAPLEFTPEARTTDVVLAVPLPDGSFGRFRIQESPILSPKLAAQHPELRTFLGQGIDDPTATARLDLTPAGFHAMILSVNGQVLVNPYSTNNTRLYIVFFKSDVVQESDFRCLFKDLGEPYRKGTFGELVPSGSALRTYRLAMTATGEYTQFFGGTVAGAQAAITTTVNRVTGVYESEVAIRLNLVAFNIYTDPATDPFTNPSDVNGTLLNQNNTDLNTNVGSANYDIGHLVNAGSGGGLAGLGVVCTASKGRGATSIGNPQGDPFDIDYVAHEMGHQFGGDHTFNGTTDNCGGVNRVASSAYEPGSGTTIMAYAGICGAENVALHSDPFFHTRSFDQITTFREGTGVCGAQTPTGNTPPGVDAGPDYTVPRATPFTITGSGSDADGDALTFCWEQFDLGDPSPPPNNANGPLFRFRPPTTSPSRTFPRLTDILSGAATPWENLPTVDRTLNFRLTARDNRAGGGGVNYDAMAITVSGEPFYVTYPNGGEVLSAGCPVTVTWNVGGGNVAANVDILYSLNNGGSFVTLLANTPNDGSESVVLPCATTAQGRIMVEAVGNIFFDVSNTRFTVNASAAPVVTCSAVGGAVDTNCQRLVTFTGQVTDDCGVLASNVTVSASLAPSSSSATVGTPTVTLTQESATSVSVSGSVLVSDLTGSPVTVRITISGSDNCGSLGSCTAPADVFDNTPPRIVVTLDPMTLWPPNHTLRDITATVTATDNCPGVTFVLTSVMSNEPDNGLGDGDTPNDIQNAIIGTADTQFQVRSERSGKGKGRVYTATYTATDGSGNSTSASAIVTVPKSQAPPPSGPELVGLEPELPSAAFLAQNYPNPFNPTSAIRYGLPVDEYVTIKVFNMLGQEVATLAEGMQSAGYNEVRFDASRLPSGIYTYVMRAGSFMSVKKMLVIK